MMLHYCKNYEAMSQKASSMLVAALQANSRQLLCAATGASPLGLYRNLASAYQKDKEVFSELRVIKLDEWAGMDEDDDRSCEAYIHKNILNPLAVTSERYLSFNAKASSLKQECVKMRRELENNGPIDICLLGMGKNGHIGFNEPSAFLLPHCHVAILSGESLTHQMLNGISEKPRRGITLGMADIFQAKKIILLISGAGKEKVIKNFLSQKMTIDLPASLLWMHPNVECFIDEQVADLSKKG